MPLLADLPGYKLTDLLSSAGATIGVIIAGTIFVQFLSTKYAELFGRYQNMTREYRGRRHDEPRHEPLRAQISAYRRRLQHLSRATWLAGAGLLGLLVAVLVGGLSIIFPHEMPFKWLGTGALGLGLVLMIGALSLELWESIIARQEIGEEVADLDEPARGGSVVQSTPDPSPHPAAG